jgi:hypothetical protein
MAKAPRPVGISILAVIDFLFGTLAVLFGFLLIWFSGALVSLARSANLEGVGVAGIGALSAFISVAGGAAVIGGLISIFLGYGFWTGRGWAWIVGVILGILGVIGGVFVSLGSYVGIVTLGVDLIILWYLFRPRVKAFFGRGPSVPAVPMPTSVTT